MSQPGRRRGRPRSNPLSRCEQLKAAQRRYRERMRADGMIAIQIRLPADPVEQLDRACELEDAERHAIIEHTLRQSLD
jgi:hypothetical protein